MSYRLLAAAPLALFVTAAAQPGAVAPAAHSFRIGAIEATALRDQVNVVPNDGKTFGVGEPTSAVADVLRANGAPTDAVRLSVDALLLRMPGHVVLIDSGLGPKAGGVLMRSLAEAGIAPTQVTDVLVTHSHPDHIGGLVGANGKPAFPRAVVRMAAAEWQFAQGGRGAAIAKVIAPQVKPFTIDGRSILPGVTPITLIGHTPGHTGYRIASNGVSLVDIGDVAHSSIVSLAKPQWRIGYDNDPAAGIQRRAITLAQLAASGQRVFAPHFPYPGVGRIVKRGAGYAFVPAA